MAFNDGEAYHGSSKVAAGRLTDTTDTDYFYFFCPDCNDRQVMRVLDYDVRLEAPGGEHYPDETPKQVRDFIFRCNCTAQIASLPTS